MIPRLNMPAGELFDLIRPSVILLAALVSIFVLASARKRFPLYVALAWALGTLFLPLVALPVFLAVLLIWRRPVRSRHWRLLLPLVYAVIVIGSIVSYFYFDSQTVDARLARATQAKLVDDSATAIKEYRRALALEDNPHTHKLLAIELANAGQLSEAVSEFRLAEQGGEPDDLIHYRLGLVFERLEQSGQAKLEFEKFLLTDTCRTSDNRCESARVRTERLTSDKTSDKNLRAF